MAQLNTPYFLVDEGLLKKNLEVLRQVQQEGPPASVPALFLVSNGKGTPLPQEEWRMCARTYLSAFSVSSLHLLDLPHDLYRCRPQELADAIHRFLSDHL